MREVLAEETQRVRSLGASASSSSSSHPLLSCGPLSEMRAHRECLSRQLGAVVLLYTDNLYAN